MQVVQAQAEEAVVIATVFVTNPVMEFAIKYPQLLHLPSVTFTTRFRIITPHLGHFNLEDDKIDIARDFVKGL